MPGKKSSSFLLEPLESRRLFSAAVVPLTAPQSVSSVKGSSGSTTANTSVEWIGAVPPGVTSDATLTVTGAKPSDPTAPRPAITVLGASGSGPHTVFVHALDSVLGAGTPLTARYVWNFGDPGSEYNTLVGWNAAHMYNNPGNYTITLTLTNQLGKTSTLSVTVTVQPATRKTIYVDSVNGNDSNNGLTPQTAIRTVDEMNKLLGSNTNILFRDGETFNVDEGIPTPYANVLFGSYGTGSPPVLMRVAGTGTSTISMFDNSSDIVVENLTFNSTSGLDTGVFPAGYDITVRNCTFLNLEDDVDEDRYPQGTLVQDCTSPLATGLLGYFVWGQGSDQVYLGNFVASSVQQHDIRTVWVDRELIAYNNLTNLDTSKGTIEVHRGAYAYVADNYVYDGELRVGPREGPAAVPGDISQWTVVEGNHVFNHEITVYPGTYHLMIRNNIITIEATACIGIVASNAAGDNIQDITIANNTGITPGVSGQFVYIGGGGAAGQISLENNLWVAPNIIPGEYGDAAVYIADSTDKVLKISSDNVWPMPTTFNPYAAGGINYVWPTWLPPHGYYTPTAWCAQALVQDDHFVATVISATDMPVSTSMAATAGAPVAGVLVDIYGNPRSLTGHNSAGAVQI